MKYDIIAHYTVDNGEVHERKFVINAESREDAWTKIFSVVYRQPFYRRLQGIKCEIISDVEKD